MPRRVEAWLVLGLCAWFVIVLGGLMLARARYPFELQWMEGGELLHARELAAGRAIYRAPSADFISFPYAPLYPAVVALAARIGGMSIGVGRAVSVVSTVGSLALAARAVRRATRSRRAAFTGAAMVAGLYGVTGFCFDVVRVDALFLFLVLASLTVASGSRRVLGAVVSALLLVLAFETKQLAAIFALVPFVTLWERRPRRAVVFALVFGVALAADQAVEQLATHGWYWVYTRRIAVAQRYDLHRVPEFAQALASHVPVLIAVTATRAVTLWRKGWRALCASPWTIAAACGFVAMVGAGLRPGGAANNLLPFYAFVAIDGVIGLTQLARSTSKLGLRSALFLTGQLLLLLYDPRRALATPRSRALAETVVRELAEAHGPVLVPDRPYDALLAGKEPSYQSDALWDWENYAGAPPEDLRERLKNGYYARIATMGPIESRATWYPSEMRERYVLREKLEPAPDSMNDWTEYTEPRFIYEPR